LAELSHWLTDEVRKVSMVVRQSPVSVVITDLDGRVEYVNPKFTEVSGYSLEDVIGQKIGFLRPELSPPGQIEELQEALLAGKEWRGTIQNHRKDGTSYWESGVIAPIRDGSGAVTNYVSIKEDITLRKEYEARLDWHANYDSLTRLPNRTLLTDRLSQMVALAGQGDHRAAVMSVDLLRMRTLTESMGHDAGDAVLRQAAERLQALSSEADTVARVGSAEFILLLSESGESRSLQSLAEHICDSLSQPFDANGAEVVLGASIGIAVYPDDGASPAELLHCAVAAHPSEGGEAQEGWRFFTPEREANARRRLTLESNLRQALRRDELQVYYHPLVEVETGRILAAEALLRWYQPDLGWVSPDQFIPIAEENGLIIPIGEWVLETVCRDMQDWTRQQLPPVRVAVNVSSQQLRDHRLAEHIGRMLLRHSIPTRLLELEVTERLLLDNSPDSMAVLQGLKAMGLRFSIDDFGTGYSSMSYLTSFPFDVLKVDRSFINKVNSSPRDAALTQAIVAMAHALGLEVVAEGVETVQQLAFVRDAACKFAQGYLFSRPVPAQDFAEILARRDGYTFAVTV
jgi:diguanylate cyclase (GGDEF)-like protein/PAS domain S-box-containing protein